MLSITICAVPLHQLTKELFGAVVHSASALSTRANNRLINKEVHCGATAGHCVRPSSVATNSGTHLHNGVEEGQHIDEGTICRVRASLETILTYFNVCRANIQLESVGWLSDNWKRDTKSIRNVYAKIAGVPPPFLLTHPSVTFAVCQWEMLASDLL